MYSPIDQLTADGYDLQFGTNVIGMRFVLFRIFLMVLPGHFYFTQLLLPLMISTARASPDGIARVITVSSMGHLVGAGLNFSTFKDSPARKKMNTVELYFQSKFVRVLIARSQHID
jgi:retinol dehydrogenase-12